MQAMTICIGHNYIGRRHRSWLHNLTEAHIDVGRTYIGHNYVGHDYIGHDRIGHTNDLAAGGK